MNDWKWQVCFMQRKAAQEILIDSSLLNMYTCEHQGSHRYSARKCQKKKKKGRKKSIHNSVTVKLVSVQKNHPGDCYWHSWAASCLTDMKSHTSLRCVFGSNATMGIADVHRSESFNIFQVTCYINWNMHYSAEILAVFIHLEGEKCSCSALQNVRAERKLAATGAVIRPIQTAA